MASMRQQEAAKELRRNQAAAPHGARSRAFGAGPAAACTSESRRALLTQAIETAVIPRLLDAHRASPDLQDQPSPAVGSPVASGHVARLVDLVLMDGQPAAMGFVEAMRDTGMSFESLCLDLLTPTAHRLGALWEDDACDITDVTIGLARLQHVMRLLGLGFAGAPAPGRAPPSALLVQMPGEQHGFGLGMVIQFFRRAGWAVSSEPVDSASLSSLVRGRAFGMVGISVACVDCLDQLAAEIRAIRRHSLNRAIAVMVGGPAFIAQPHLAAQVGADATASDGLQAVHTAEALVRLQVGAQ